MNTGKKKEPQHRGRLEDYNPEFKIKAASGEGGRTTGIITGGALAFGKMFDLFYLRKIIKREKLLTPANSGGGSSIPCIFNY